MSFHCIFKCLQSALISAFQRRNVEAFKYALEHLRADSNLIDHRLDMTIFEKILMTPKSSEFISLCIDNGADLYQVNKFKSLAPHRLNYLSVL